MIAGEMSQVRELGTVTAVAMQGQATLPQSAVLFLFQTGQQRHTQLLISWRIHCFCGMHHQ